MVEWIWRKAGGYTNTQFGKHASWAERSRGAPRQSAKLTPRAEGGRARMPPAGRTEKHLPFREKLGSREKQTLREVAGGCVSVVICGDIYTGEFGIWAIEGTKSLQATRCCLLGRCWWPGALEVKSEFTCSLGSFVWRLWALVSEPVQQRRLVVENELRSSADPVTSQTKESD